MFLGFIFVGSSAVLIVIAIKMIIQGFVAKSKYKENPDVDFEFPARHIHCDPLLG